MQQGALGRHRFAGSPLKRFIGARKSPNDIGFPRLSRRSNKFNPLIHVFKWCSPALTNIIMPHSPFSIRKRAPLVLSRFVRSWIGRLKNTHRAALTTTWRRGSKARQSVAGFARERFPLYKETRVNPTVELQLTLASFAHLFLAADIFRSMFVIIKETAILQLLFAKCIHKCAYASKMYAFEYACSTCNSAFE